MIVGLLEAGQRRLIKKQRDTPLPTYPTALSMPTQLYPKNPSRALQVIPLLAEQPAPLQGLSE